MDGNVARDNGRSYPLTNADIDAYRRDGIVCLRKVFDAAAVEKLREAVAWTMANPGPWAMNFVGDKTKPPFFGDVFAWTRHPAYAEACVNGYAAEIAGRLMGAREVRFYFDHLLVKEPGSAAPRAVERTRRAGSANPPPRITQSASASSPVRSSASSNGYGW